MRKRLVSFCAVLLCGIFSATCLVPAAAAFSNLEQLPIDPWEELVDIQNRPEITTETPEQLPDVEELPYTPENNRPMNGGVNSRSINDNNANRSLIMNGYVRWGFDALENSLLDLYHKVDFTNVALDQRNNVKLATYTGSYVSRSGFMRVAAGTTFDLIAPVDYSSDVYESVTFTGAGLFYLYVEGGSISSYPDEVVLLVNGEEYGEIYDATTGFTMYTVHLPLDEDITSLGYRFIWNELQEASLTNYNGSYRNLCACYIDTGSFAIAEVEGEPEYNGILETIVGWLRNVAEGITSLGSTIVNGLLEGISGLFVPTEQEITEMKDQYSILLSERLGFIYQGYEWTISSAEEIVSTMQAQEEYSFTFPGISIPYQGQTLTIVPQQPVSMENAVMDVLRPVLGTIISLISVAAFAHTAFDMITALISGVSYFGFLKGKRGGNNE